MLVSVEERGRETDPKMSISYQFNDNNRQWETADAVEVRAEYSWRFSAVEQHCVTLTEILDVVFC